MGRMIDTGQIVQCSRRWRWILA